MPDRHETAFGIIAQAEQLDAARMALAAAVRKHEYAVTAGYDAALAREPGLKCAEWLLRNPFVTPSIQEMSDHGSDNSPIRAR